MIDKNKYIVIFHVKSGVTFIRSKHVDINISSYLNVNLI